jgi:hypothetical protein
LLKRLFKERWALPVEGDTHQVQGVETKTNLGRWTYAIVGEQDGYSFEPLTRPKRPNPGLYRIQAQAPPEEILDAMDEAVRHSTPNNALIRPQTSFASRAPRSRGGRPRLDLQARWVEAQQYKRLYASWAKAAAAWNRDKGDEVTALQMEAWGRDCKKCFRKRRPVADQHSSRAA